MHEFNPIFRLLQITRKLQSVQKKSSVSLTMRRIDTQVDGHRGDALVGPSDAVSLGLDLLPNLIKIREPFALAVEKLSMF